MPVSLLSLEAVTFDLSHPVVLLPASFLCWQVVPCVLHPACLADAGLLLQRPIPTFLPCVLDQAHRSFMSWPDGVPCIDDDSIGHICS